ncbi:arginyltransferase [Saezia sanguinis]|uniref:arginyltransferase n=1 Tax=Saezia sanguinis TaxID=1965230 RepID=UPI003058E203
MSFAQEPHLFRLQFYTTAPYPCSYLDKQIACSQVAVPAHLVNTPVYSRLIRQGFRRSGMFVYRPHCENCQACVSLRIPVTHFCPSRSQRRTMQKLGHLQVRTLNLHYSEEHYNLYQRYQQKRHPGGGMDEDSCEQYQQFLLRSPVSSYLIEYREPAGDSAQSGILRMVSIIDVLDDGLSAVYTFYDPDQPQAGYGTYGVLWQIEYAKRLSLSHVYLGYWIHGSPKMAYKVNFEPFEALSLQGWQRFCRETPGNSQAEGVHR